MRTLKEMWPAGLVLGIVALFIGAVLGAAELDSYMEAHNPQPQSYSYSYSYKLNGYSYSYSYKYDPEVKR